MTNNDTLDTSFEEIGVGFMRLPDVLKLVPVSRSSWWAGVKCGRFPKPCKIGPRTTAWRKKDIHNLISRLEDVQAKEC